VTIDGIAAADGHTRFLVSQNSSHSLAAGADAAVLHQDWRMA
jgi:hypothetical protein